MNRHHCLTILITVSVLLSVTAAHALINPRFTPVHLVEQATLIVSVEPKEGKSKDDYTAAVREVL